MSAQGLAAAVLLGMSRTIGSVGEPLVVGVVGGV